MRNAKQNNICKKKRDCVVHRRCGQRITKASPETRTKTRRTESSTHARPAKRASERAARQRLLMPPEWPEVCPSPQPAATDITVSHFHRPHLPSKLTRQLRAGTERALTVSLATLGRDVGTKAAAHVDIRSSRQLLIFNDLTFVL